MPNTFAVWNAAAPGGGTATSTPKTAGALGKQDFLNLLAAQLRQQNPLQPMDNAQFMSQTAQFNTLEQLQQLNESLTAALGLSSLTQASGLIGKHVVAVGADNTKIEGTVSEVALTDGKPMLLVDGTAVAVDSVVIVRSAGNA